MGESFPSFLDGRVRVVTGDITSHDVTAIVNAANSTLLGGGGVDGAIHRMGGPQILVECKQIRETTHPHGLPTGEAVITTAGNLAAQYVIHTVGPIYGRNPSREAELLAACYKNSLRLARQYAVATIAFPSISTGAYGFPSPRAAHITVITVLNGIRNTPSLKRVVFCCFGKDSLVHHDTALAAALGPGE